MPRLPMSVPRPGRSTISPNGVTLFLNGILPLIAPRPSFGRGNTHQGDDIVLAREHIGLVANEQNGWPSAAEVVMLGPAWVRTIVYDLDRFGQLIAALPADIGVIALLNSETQLVPPAVGTVGPESSADWESHWSSLIDGFVQRFGNGRAGRTMAVECLNEWDLHGIAVENVIKSVQLAAPSLKAARVKVLLASVASANWPAQLAAAMAKLLDADRANLDGVCFHPYAKTVGDGAGKVVPAEWDGVMQSLKEAVLQANDIVNPLGVANALPMWLTEFGLNRTDVGGSGSIQAAYVRQAFADLGDLPDGIVEAACLFCWNDSVGSPGEQFGLRPVAGDPPYPAWQAFKDCTAGTAPPAVAEPAAAPVV